MTQVPAASDRAEAIVIEQELNRTAWNLPRRSVREVVRAVPRSSGVGVAESADNPVGERVPVHVTNGANAHTTVESGLDWQDFRSLYFPGRRRHDFEAIVAYAVYRRSARATESETVSDHETLDACEGEGGAPR